MTKVGKRVNIDYKGGGFMVGAVVYASCAGHPGEGYPVWDARILRVNSDGTYQVKYECDNSVLERVPQSWIRGQFDSDAHVTRHAYGLGVANQNAAWQCLRQKQA